MNLSHKQALKIALLATTSAMPIGYASAQTVTTLYNFYGVVVENPTGPLIDVGGKLFGLAEGGIVYGYGTAFEFDTATGSMRLLHRFMSSPGDGCQPSSLLYYEKSLYGTASACGNQSNAGTIFKIDLTSGQESVAYAFNGGSDGYAPDTLINDQGVLYGTTGEGGSMMAGTLFKFDPQSGQMTNLYTFSGTDGYAPDGIVIAGGKLFGVAYAGGKFGAGVAFEYDLATGQETTLHDFSGGADGATPVGPLTYHDGSLYAATIGGGAGNVGVVFKLNPSTQTEDVLYSFGLPPDCSEPTTSPVYFNGALYGTSNSGGSGLGCAYSIDLATGTESAFSTFSGSLEGTNPAGPLVAGNGVLFGTAAKGGAYGYGTIFNVSP